MVEYRRYVVGRMSAYGRKGDSAATAQKTWAGKRPEQVVSKPQYAGKIGDLMKRPRRPNTDAYSRIVSPLAYVWQQVCCVRVVMQSCVHDAENLLRGPKKGDPKHFFPCFGLLIGQYLSKQIRATWSIGQMPRKHDQNLAKPPTDRMTSSPDEDEVSSQQ